MSTKTTQLDWREGRRRRAWELKQQGWKQQDIAAALGVTEGAVSHWLKRAREQGVEGLRRPPAPGPQPRLTPEQLAQLPALPRPAGVRSGSVRLPWAGVDVPAGGRSHPPHVWRQVSSSARQSALARRAPQRAAATHTGYPAQRNATHRRFRPGGRSAGRRAKKARAEGRTIVWGDQSGFYLLPMAVRTWAPWGVTSGIICKLGSAC